MKKRSLIVLRPVCFFVFLIVVVLSLAALLITFWLNEVARIEKEVKLIAHNNNHEFLSQIHNVAAFFSPNNASAINLARILSFSLDNNDPHFSDIESKVAPALFQASSTIRYLSQISYIGLNGLFFAYSKEGDELYALYSNSTFSSRNDTEGYTWYLQTANRDSGKLYGEVSKFPPPSLLNASWFQEALSSTNGHASVGSGWRIPQGVLLLSTVRLDGIGAISLGFRMKPLIDFLVAKMALYDGGLYLVAKDWNVAVQGLPNTHAIFDGDHVSFQLLNRDVQTIVNISCHSYDVELRDVALTIEKKKYVMNCLRTEIGGLQFVKVFVVARDAYSSLVDKNIRFSFLLLVAMVGAVVITICVFVSMIVEAARREMFLCNALINQMESTQQSERKSMNKSLAFASASHDIRASLAGITGLIELCRSEVTKKGPWRSEVEENLSQMEDCTRDLLGILNCILDTSKIEAGKMQLEEEEFNIEQLLEDVVDLYHPAAMKKGVDVILDPCDGSISRSCWAKGDRTKLKQILSNLLSNAVKFTSEGHVSVGAWARKPCLKDEIIGSNKNSWMSWLLCLLFKIHRAENESEITNGDPDSMGYMFEVNDTGKGIPKEKRESVFENYIQVKETALGQQGTGLGLGIVQSLVRLMGGEIRITEKDVGERGTCFRFNVVLSAGANGESYSSQHSGLPRRVESSEAERSLVILCITSDQRRNVLHKFIRRLGVKVHVVMQQQQLRPILKKVKRKLNMKLSNYSSSGNSSTRSVPLSSLDGTDEYESHQNRPNAGSGFFVVMVIETRLGPFGEMSRVVSEFRRDLNERCCSRVVWLNAAADTNFDEDELGPPDLVISKPFHGSRLYQTIALLPEFGGIPPRKGHISATDDIETARYAVEEERKPLMGKKILVVDDDPVGRKIATFVASQLGAACFCCENGAAACHLVCKSLGDEPARFDCILMDCQMPVMDGTEATGRIREAESGYGVRTTIVALTAHKKGDGEEVENMMQAGVDAYITKPLNKDNLLSTLSSMF